MCILGWIRLSSELKFSSLISWWVGQPMSLLCLFALLWCNQLNSQTQALLWLHSPGHTFSGVHPNCFLVTPENSINLLGGEQDYGPLWSHLLHLSLPLKPQGLKRLSLREKNQTEKEKLTHEPAPHLHLSFLFILSASLDESKGQRVKWKSPISPPACLHMIECYCWSRVGPVKLFPLYRHQSNFEMLKIPSKGLSPPDIAHIRLWKMWKCNVLAQWLQLNAQRQLWKSGQCYCLTPHQESIYVRAA